MRCAFAPLLLWCRLGCVRKASSLATGNSDSDEKPTWANTKPYIPKVSQGLVIKVYDGDTITIAAKIPGDDTSYRFSVRLNGIDCPEIKGKNDDEKELAQKGKKAMSDLVLGEVVQLEGVKLEKFGRLLATVMYNGHDLNQWMLDQHFALPYGGGTKEVNFDWKAFHKKGKVIHFPKKMTTVTTPDTSM
jgi:micrococcal nuclease